MKKIYTLFFAALLCSQLLGQTPLTTAADFTANDINGVSHNLFSILNSGKYVCIMFTMNG
ncbi:MAG: hypothetical protein PHT69_14220 [Bacteroidales bacterium]|nr:hypothetical protein [Bacteroidales bacterium]